jgi:hypothetical protein
MAGEPARLMLFERSARRDVRWWGLLLVGLVFAYAGATINPASNCSADGECAPWLVPLAFGCGVIAALGGAAQLIVNPSRGSYVDAATRELVWWLGRVADGRASDAGRLPLAHIARAVVVEGSDSDELFLYDCDGALLPFPSDEVMPWPYRDWASQLAGEVPGMVVEERRG